MTPSTVRVTLIVLGTLVCHPGPAHGLQQALDATVIREYLVAGFEANKKMDLAIVAAIPDSAMRWAPVPGMRGFARQVAHGADNYWIAPGLGVARQSFGDSSQYHHDPAVLAASVTNAYDWVLSHLATMADHELFAVREFFGTPTPTWRVFMMAMQHATWTRGQLVPYFRAHRVRVPRFRLF